LVADDAIKDMLGPEFVQGFLHINEMLATVIDRREGEPEAQAIARLVENY